jgi:hypothetical protein
VNVKKTGAAATHRFIPGYRSSRGRAVVSFEYMGQMGNDERRIAEGRMMMVARRDGAREK